jgi:hypothetical protein
MELLVPKKRRNVRVSRRARALPQEARHCRRVMHCRRVGT